MTNNILFLFEPTTAPTATPTHDPLVKGKANRKKKNPSFPPSPFVPQTQSPSTTPANHVTSNLIQFLQQVLQQVYRIFDILFIFKVQYREGR